MKISKLTTKSRLNRSNFVDTGVKTLDLNPKSKPNAIVARAIGSKGSHAFPIANEERKATFSFQKVSIPPELFSLLADSKKPKDDAQSTNAAQIRLKWPAFKNTLPILVTMIKPRRANFPVLNIFGPDSVIFVRLKTRNAIAEVNAMSKRMSNA